MRVYLGQNVYAIIDERKVTLEHVDADGHTNKFKLSQEVCVALIDNLRREWKKTSSA